MARKPTPQAQPLPPKLVKPRNEAREAIVSRIEGGRSLAAYPIESPTDLETARAGEAEWQAYNYEMLRRLFTTEEYAADYRNSEFGHGMVAMYREKYFNEKVDDFIQDVNSQLAYLQSLATRLDLIDEDVSVTAASSGDGAPRARSKTSRRIFIVHGRDEQMKAVVARFVDHCGLDPVILHEQADKGRTIIEKFEEASDDVAFAIVLLSPDDVGALKSEGGDEPQLQGRARQNVILELGFFVGVLGRSRVMALKKGDLELPSDYAGVIYTPFDAADGWKLQLARELKAAGLEVDMNKALG